MFYLTVSPWDWEPEDPEEPMPEVTLEPPVTVEYREPANRGVYYVSANGEPVVHFVEIPADHKKRAATFRIATGRVGGAAVGIITREQKETLEAMLANPMRIDINLSQLTLEGKFVLAPNSIPTFEPIGWSKAYWDYDIFLRRLA